jgi:hypothetical protein
MRFLLPAICLLVVYVRSYGQGSDLTEVISSVIEELADDDTNPEAAAIYAEKLFDLAENPVSINSADESELSRLFFLTDFQIKALQDYILTSGRIYSIYEIASVPGFDSQLVRMISNFVNLNTEQSSRPGPGIIRNELISNFSVRYPLLSESAQGPPWKLLSKYKLAAGRLTGNIVAEKDAYEALLSGKRNLPDFLSASLEWNGRGIIRKVITGDFGARFGLGTSINTGLRTGLSLTQTGYLSGGDEIRSYTSTEENIFFRGAAIQMQVKNTGLTMFWSGNRIDATMDTAENGKDVFVETFQRSGLHNTLSSARHKDAVTEFTYGVNMSGDFKYVRIGLLWTENRFTIPVRKSVADPEDYFDFEGTENSIATAYYKAIIDKILLYGEISSNLNSKMALVQGLSFRPSDRLAINFLYRNYDPGYSSFHGKGLFSNSSGDNLKGLFGNFIYEAAPHLFLSAGCDLRIFPWLKYQCSAPSIAVSREVRLKYQPTDILSIDAVYGYKLSELDLKRSVGTEKQEIIKSRSIKGSLRYSPEEKLTLTTRLDYKTVQPDGERGMLLLEDISYRFASIPATVWFRYCIFTTSGWDSRIYAYENDLYQSFSIPALSGKGTRSYMMISLKAFHHIDFRIKFGITEINQWSTGRKNNTELKIQARIRL